MSAVRLRGSGERAGGGTVGAGRAPRLTALDGRGLGRYASLLPGGAPDGRVSLGEGGTPLVRSRVVGPRMGLRGLYFKNETANPTWSFKDRYVTVTVNVARSLGFQGAIVSSTGNLGVSAAAFCAAAGMECIFLAPPETAQPFLAQAALHGAHVLVTTWEGVNPSSSTSPGAGAGSRSASFFRGPSTIRLGWKGTGRSPTRWWRTWDGCPAPCCSLRPGNGLYGTWKGFREARQWGWARDLPMMVACQPIGANSLEVSLQRGLAEVVELPPIESVATSTRETVARCPCPARRAGVGGEALSATDREILDAQAMLGREGLCVEPSSALPVACLPRLLAAGKCQPMTWSSAC